LLLLITSLLIVVEVVNLQEARRKIWRALAIEPHPDQKTIVRIMITVELKLRISRIAVSDACAGIPAL
jgi:DNA-binding phage protein